MKTLLSIMFIGLIFLSFNNFAADFSNGKDLHADSCLACHNSTKYTTKTRKVHDLAALESRVKRCDFSLGTQWFDEDITDVVAYLNHTIINSKSNSIMFKVRHH